MPRSYQVESVDDAHAAYVQQQNIFNMVNEAFTEDEIQNSRHTAERGDRPQLPLAPRAPGDRQNLQLITAQERPKDPSPEPPRELPQQQEDERSCDWRTNYSTSENDGSGVIATTDAGDRDQTRSTWKQHMAALLAALGAMSVGYVDAWTANALPFLQAPLDTANATLRTVATVATTLAAASVLSHNTDELSLLDQQQSQAFTTEVAAYSTVPPAFTAGILANSTTHPSFAQRVVHDITAEQASWLSSLVPIGAMLGSIPAGVIADVLGRRVTLLAMAVPCLASWLIIIFYSDSVEMLYLSRGIAGVIMGIVLVVIPLYNEEIAEVSIRGAIGVYQNMMVTIGILFCYIVGALVPYIWTAIIPCVIPLVMFFTFTWMPESPVYLFSTHRYTEAYRVIRWLRGSKSDLGADVLQASEAAQRTRAGKASLLLTLKRIFTALTTQPSAYALRVVFLLMVFRQLTGIHAVVFYTVEIFEDAKSPIPAPYAAIIIGVVEVASTYAASLLVDKMGRRVLLLTSGIGTAMCHLILASYYGFLNFAYELEGISWFPIVFIPCFIILYACGFGPLPWFMMAELTPNEHKNWASGLTGFLNWGSMFLVLKLFPTITSHLGEYVTFTIFALNCTIASVFVFVWVPETKGKTLEEIQDEIAQGRR